MLKKFLDIPVHIISKWKSRKLYKAANIWGQSSQIFVSRIKWLHIT